MSKTEKFIDDCTRNCSNLLYRDYIGGFDKTVYQPWLTPDEARKAVEIAREEVKEQLWVDADSDDLPITGKWVIALQEAGPYTYKVVYAYRVGTSPVTLVEKAYGLKKYGKAGWNMPRIKYWLNVELPKYSGLRS